MFFRLFAVHQLLEALAFLLLTTCPRLACEYSIICPVPRIHIPGYVLSPGKVRHGVYSAKDG
jgi:hypothetical protein